jgi:hypothetical protein
MPLTAPPPHATEESCFMATDVPSAPSKAKTKSDVYTGMLIISLVALLAGSLFLWLDMRRYPPGEPPRVQPAPSVPAK